MTPEEKTREEKIQRLIEGYATRILEGRDDLFLLSILEYGFPGFRHVDEGAEFRWPAQNFDDWLANLTEEDEIDEYHRRDCQGDSE